MLRRYSTLSCLVPVALFFVLLFSPRSLHSEDTDLILSRWNNSYNVRAWSGYKDNVLLGQHASLDSPFVAAGLDALIWRMPVNGWEYLFFGTGDYIRYLPGREVDKEVIAIGQAQAKKHFANEWHASAAFEYAYFDQVFDNSTFERDLAFIKVRAQSFTLRPSVRKDFPKHWLELELALNRQDFQKFIDDYWEGGPKVSWGRPYGIKSEFVGSYRFNHRFHDTRAARDRQGALLPGTHLEFQQHEIAAALRHNWDQSKHWRTVSKISLERNEDNGPGYYDYWRPQLSQQIRYQATHWQVKSEARVWYYHYDSQPLSDLDFSARRKTSLLISLRGERNLTKALKVFAEYEHERSISNLTIDEYQVNTVMAGVDWEF